MKLIIESGELQKIANEILNSCIALYDVEQDNDTDDLPELTDRIRSAAEQLITIMKAASVALDAPKEPRSE